jgi:hypothetical protein
VGIPENLNANVTIPRWFVWFLSIFLTVSVFGAVPWANGLAGDITAIRGELRSINRIYDSELRDIRRRLDKLEANCESLLIL